MIFSFMVYAQERIVTGKVYDSSGESIIGASVMVQGTMQGAVEEERPDGKPVSRPGHEAAPLPRWRTAGAGRRMALRVRRGREPDGTLPRHGKVA